MANIIDREISKTEEGIGNLSHMKKLADAMAPDPTEWSYEGDMSEDDSGQSHCTCGHPIRYIFTIRRHRDGATLPIGSVCIDSSIPYLTTCGAGVLAEALASAREKLDELMKERQRLIREAKGNDRYTFLATYATDLHEWIVTTLRAVRDRSDERNWRLPFYSGYFYNSEYKALIADPTASTPGRAAASLEKRIVNGLQYSELLIKQLAGSSYRDIPAPMPFTLKDFQTATEAFKTSQKGKTRKAASPTAEGAESTSEVVSDPDPLEGDVNRFTAAQDDERPALAINTATIRGDGTTWEEWKASVEYLLRERTRQHAVYYGDATEEWWQGCFRTNYTPESAIYQLELEVFAEKKDAEEWPDAQKVPPRPVDEEAEILATLERHSQERESEESRDPNDLTGRTYCPDKGPYAGQTITILERFCQDDRKWTVRAPDGRCWPVGRAALERALGPS